VMTARIATIAAAVARAATDDKGQMYQIVNEKRYSSQ
jgi:hypothetical protein